MYLDYDDLYKVSIFALRANRSYYTIPRDGMWWIFIFIFHGFYFFIFLMFVNSAIFHGTFSTACTNVIFCVFFIQVSFKYIVLVTKSDAINATIARMRHDYDYAKDLDPYEQSVISKYAKTASWVTKIWLLLSTGTFSVFPIKAVTLSVYYYWIGDFRFIHMYEMTYPKIMEERKADTTMYFFLLFVQCYFGLYTIIMYIGFTPVALIFMLHACGQLDIIDYRFKHLFDGEEDHYDPLELRERLKNIVKPLQDTLEFIELLKETFRVAYELDLKGVTVVLPIAMYEIFQSLKEGQPNIEFLTFISAGVVLSLVPCYYSDLLMEKGNMVRMSVYTSGWEAYPDPSMRRTLTITLARLQRDVAIRTLFRTLNLDTFAELCHQSYAIFSVINTAWS